MGRRSGAGRRVIIARIIGVHGLGHTSGAYFWDCAASTMRIGALLSTIIASRRVVFTLFITSRKDITLDTISLDSTLIPDNLLRPISPSVFYKRKRKWKDLSNLSEIPTWDQLQHEISLLEANPAVAPNHPFLVQLRQQRYALLEACRPTHFPEYANRYVPLSHRDTSLSLWETADETNLSKILLHYADLSALDTGPLSPLEELLSKFQRCVEHASLSRIHRQLVILRMQGLTIDEIKQKLGLSYSNNYLSTLYQQVIIPKLKESWKELYANG